MSELLNSSTPELLKKSLKIKRQGDDFCTSLVDGVGIHHHVAVAKMIGMVSVERVGEAIHEFQLGTEFKKWKIEVTANAQLCIEVVTLQLQIVVVATREINHRVETRHEIRTVIVEAGGCNNQVDGAGDVGGLHVLVLLSGFAVDIHVGVIEECEMAVAKIHGRGDAQLEIGVQTQLTKYAHIETIVPAVLVT